MVYSILLHSLHCFELSVVLVLNITIALLSQCKHFHCTCMLFEIYLSNSDQIDNNCIAMIEQKTFYLSVVRHYALMYGFYSSLICFRQIWEHMEAIHQGVVSDFWSTVIQTITFKIHSLWIKIPANLGTSLICLQELIQVMLKKVILPIKVCKNCYQKDACGINSPGIFLFDFSLYMLLKYLNCRYIFLFYCVSVFFDTGQRQCLVQLSTMPVAVCHGVGASTDEAHAQAAHHALQYLKIMTKKA